MNAETFPRSLFGRPTQRAYKAAVKQIVLNVQAARGWDDQELADFVGCSRDTIKNARKEAHTLDVLTLLNLAYAFGESAIEPVRALYLCAPVESATAETRLNRIEREINALRKELEG